MLDLVQQQLETQPVMSKGDRHQAVQQSIPAYDKGVTLPMSRVSDIILDKKLHNCLRLC
jgi:coenzyme F420 hydrogenase subunit beta